MEFLYPRTRPRLQVRQSNRRLTEVSTGCDTLSSFPAVSENPTTPLNCLAPKGPLSIPFLFDGEYAIRNRDSSFAAACARIGRY